MKIQFFLIIMLLLNVYQGQALNSKIFDEDFSMEEKEYLYFNFTVIHPFIIGHIDLRTSRLVVIYFPEGFYYLNYYAQTFDFDNFTYEYPENGSFSTYLLDRKLIILAGNHSIKLWSWWGNVTGHFLLENITEQYITTESQTTINKESTTKTTFSFLILPSFLAFLTLLLKRRKIT